jgi:hypothetical protein
MQSRLVIRAHDLAKLEFERVLAFVHDKDGHSKNNRSEYDKY